MECINKLVSINIMNSKYKLLAIVSFTIMIGFFLLRNTIRIFFLSNQPVVVSQVNHIQKINESNFSVDLYECKRRFNNKFANLYNQFFNDKALVIRIPIEHYYFKNLVLSPIGPDTKNDKANIYFNTLFFDNDYLATTGVIDERKNINRKNPRKKRIGIDDNGKLNSFSSTSNEKYNDVLQAPFTFKMNSRTSNNFRTLNFRQFVSFENGNLIYISGLNNSLISWMDIKSIMQVSKLTSVIALDGGASLDYFFEGKINNYSFSSVPLRHLWFNRNSPYYIEAKIKSN